MAVYNEKHIEELLAALDTVTNRADSLVERLLSFDFSTKRSEEFAIHGVARRIKAIAHSLRKIFAEIPPDLNDLPEDGRREEATCHILSTAIHTYGSFDNLAHIWVAERGICRKNGKPLSWGQIGFQSKCSDFCSSLPSELQARLNQLHPWMTYLEEFRHSSAHRIPLYIPPYVVDPLNSAEYDNLSRAAQSALLNSEYQRYDALIEDRSKLCSFRPMISTSIFAGKTALFHPQLLADFATVEEWTNLILDAIKQPPATSPP